MNLPNKWASDLLGKDKQKALIAAQHILNNADLDAWNCLIENSEFIFGYIKDRAGQNLVKAANSSNIENIFALLKHHSSDWDDCIAECLKNNANEFMNSKILELLSSGSQEEKAYAAKYYCLMSDNNAKDALFAASKEDYQPLKNNAAYALGKLNDHEAYNYYIEKLKIEDDWEKIEAAEFLSNYGNKEAIIPMLEAMSSSGMAEYIAGEVASFADVCELLDREGNAQILVLEAIDNIISGLAETWGLSAILSFNLYECVEKLINLAKNNQENELSGKYAQLLLKMKSKINLFIENSQYTFDEEKTVLAELEEIYHLLACEDDDFWNQMTQNINREFETNDVKRKLAAISIINELELKNSAQYLKDTILNDNESEIVMCEAILTLIKFGMSSYIKDIKGIMARIKDTNLLAIVENSLVYSE